MNNVELAPEVKMQKIEKMGRWKKFKVKMLSSYYGRPIEDLKLILVWGERRQLAVQIMTEILNFSGRKAEGLVVGEKMKLSVLHKFLSDAWKKGASYVVVGVPFGMGDDEGGERSLEWKKGLNEQARELLEFLYELPVEMAVGTDYVAGEELKEILEVLRVKSGKKGVKLVVGREVSNFEIVDEVIGEVEALSFGRERGALVRIGNVMEYKKGVEVVMTYGSEVFAVATLATGEEVPEVLGAVVAGGYMLGLGTEEIVEGIAEWGF